MRPQRWVAMAASAVLLALQLGCAASPQTTYIDDTGRSVTVDWANYPTEGQYSADEVLAGPTVEETEARMEAMLTAVQEELDAEFGTSDWVAIGEDGWYPTEGNGYGGDDMLIVYNSVTWQSETPVPRERWAEVNSVVGHVVEAWRLSEGNPSFSEGLPEWMASGVFTGGTEWLDVTVQNANLDDEARSEAEGNDSLVQGVTLFYGISTLHEKDLAEFAKRAAPFEGLDHPDPTHSD